MRLVHGHSAWVVSNYTVYCIKIKIVDVDSTKVSFAPPKNIWDKKVSRSKQPKAGFSHTFHHCHSSTRQQRRFHESFSSTKNKKFKKKKVSSKQPKTVSHTSFQPCHSSMSIPLKESVKWTTKNSFSYFLSTLPLVNVDSFKRKCKVNNQKEVLMLLVNPATRQCRFL